MEEKKSLLVRGVIIGGVVGSAVLAVKSKSKVSLCLKKCYASTTSFAKFINDNRTEIINQIKVTSDKVTKAIDESNHDLKAISENIKHLKNSSSQVIHTVQETKEQILNMYGSGQININENSNQNLQEKKDA